jgi:cytochrome c oxidase subunit I
MASIPAAGRVVAQAAADRFRTEKRVAAANLAVALAALAVGGLMGILQILSYNGIDLYRVIRPVLPGGYYQGLTVHGVLNVLVFTTFYIMGFLSFIAARAFDRPLASPRLAWAAFAIMMVGLVSTAVPLLANRATVMFTFYPPLKADFFYYLGLTLVVAGTWLLTVNLALTLRAWRAEHPGQRTPLAAFMAIITMTMWTLSTVGIAAEMIFLLLPWSLGLLPGVDVVTARTLFWFTGHPIVYFWLLPAYVSWYTLIPRQAGGRLFSEPMARVAFILFLVLSIPIGIHHQVADPGISEIWKLVHAVFTVGVFFPSLLTFFNVVASLENGGRARGGKGWLAWIFKLPWGEPSFTTQVLAMILFAFGGIGGLINASYNVNLVVHNTAWISGHFHLTVGTAVALTFMGIAYWLVPLLSGRALWSRRVALAQAWLWFIGMGIFSHWMHSLGLMGMPRRTSIGDAAYLQPEWQPLLTIAMLGGLIMFVSAALFYLNIVLTATIGRRVAQEPAVPFARAVHGGDEAPAILDRFRPWIVCAVALIVLNYGPTLFQLISTIQLNVPGLSPW